MLCIVRFTAFAVILLISLTTKNAVSQELNARQTPPNDIDSKIPQSYFFYRQSEFPVDCYDAMHQCSSSVNSGVYFIKPAGYPEPFEVYCDNSLENGGWTVLQRRLDGSIDFNRKWEEYEAGFGFLSNEFWLGNDRIAYLTNQRTYQLRIEMTKADGSMFNLSYDDFRISDGFSNYKLVSVGQANLTSDVPITLCPTNKVFGNCTCEGSCSDPNGCTNSCSSGSTACVCPSGYLMDDDTCQPERECGCYLSGANDGRGLVLPEGEEYIAPNCQSRCSCSNGQLDCDDSYQCHPNAICEERDDLLQCYCNVGYTGNGLLCTRLVPPSDCQEIYGSGERDNGIYQIKPTSWTGSPFDVYCNMTDEGGWTVFQRHIDGSQDFFLYWDNYKQGFGSLTNNFWLGNDKIYSFTNQRRYQLRVDLVNSNGVPYFAKYDFFRINDENDNYRLQLGSYRSESNAGDSLTYHHNRPFTTRDRDNDAWSSNCATDCYYYYYYYYCNGAWWYGNCAHSSLNSPYGQNSFYWYHLPSGNKNIKFSEMKLLPV
ncbi:uncharacterized protein [Apostichopus japonicus]|uniref:uncharacterized protein n=1 Tax=Stichopus japonicus TaxID=307972 RepID=UPI003AB3E837